MKINLLDSKYENNQNSDDAILAKAKAIKLAKKVGIDWYSNIEYHEEYGYFNFTIENNQCRLRFQILIKEKELYYRFENDNNPILSVATFELIGYLNNQNEKCNKFYTSDAIKYYLIMIDHSLNRK